MFGTLILVLPTPHEGGELVLQHQGKKWTFDAAQMLSPLPHSSTPRLAYIAFFGDVDHEGPDVRERHGRLGARPALRRLGEPRTLLPEVHRQGHAELGRPDVRGVQQVILVGEKREAVASPIRPPGVLHDEPLPGVADDHDRMPGFSPPLAPDDRQFQRALVTVQDSTIVCNTRYLASAMSERAYGSKLSSSAIAPMPILYNCFPCLLIVYAVKFAVPPGIHGEETSYVFQNGMTMGVDQGVADRLQQYIVSFVMNSVPTDTNGLPMPVYGAAAQLTNLATSGSTTVKDDAANARCNWWQRGLYA